MTTQAGSRLERYMGLTAYWVAYVGTLCIWLLLGAIVLVPIGTLIGEYWAPKLQGIWQPSPAKIVRGSK